MNPLPPDPWRVLGLDQNEDDPARIKSAYRKLVLKCHPDKVQDPTLKALKQDEFHQVQQAYELLSDDKKKGAYLDQLKLRELQEKLRKEMPAQGSPMSRATPPKTYYEYNVNVNVRNAEPPSSFRPGPPPGASPYSGFSSSPQFSSSWEREMPMRSKPIYEEDRKAGRPVSYEKPSRREEETREERRRRKEKEDEMDQREHESARQAERERRRAEKRREEEKEKERRRAEEREAKLEQEKAERKAEKRRQEKANEKDRGRQRRRDQDDKYRDKKPAYVEADSGESEEEIRVSLKTKKSSSSSKKQTETAARDRSSRGDRTDHIVSEPTKSDSKHEQMLRNAADYMDTTRRKGSKSGTSAQYPDGASYSTQYPDPDDAWHPDHGRRSHEEKRYAEPLIIDVDGPETVHITPNDSRRVPALHRSRTSPVGAMPTPTASRPIPHLGRSQTMQSDYGRPSPPQAPPAPEKRYSGSSKHPPSSSDRRGRAAHVFDPDDDTPRRSSARTLSARPVNETVYVVGPNQGADGGQRTYRKLQPQEAVYYTTTGTTSFPKVKVSPSYGEQVYVSRRITDEDISYSATPPHATSRGYQYAY